MRRLLALPILILLAGCPPWDEPDPTPAPFPPPSLAILAPASGADVVAEPDAARSVLVGLQVQGLTLRAPGTCLASEAPCGHLLVAVDGGACPGPAGPTNAVATGSPARASLQRCPEVEGPHTIAVSAVDDAGAPYVDAAGAAVRAEVQVRVALPSLLDRIGGPSGAQRLAVAMIERQLADPNLSAYFRNASVDHERMADCLAAFFEGLAAGQVQKDGDCALDLGAAHEGLGISGVDFADWLANLDGALAGLGVGADDAAAMRALVEPLGAQIVEDPASNATLYQRLGRREGLWAAVQVFVAHLLAEPTVARYFLDANGLPDYSPAFGVCLMRLLGSLDGPFIYGEELPHEPELAAEGRACRPMGQVHDGLASAAPEEAPIGPEEFLTVAGVLVETLVYLGVPQADIDLLVQAMNLPLLCLDVVADPDKCAALF